MIIFNKEKKLEKHIKALITAYDSQIELLEKEITKKKTTDENGDEEEIKLSDAQIKIFAEGISRLSDTADKLFEEINAKIITLEDWKNRLKTPKKDGSKITPNNQKKETAKSSMNKHLN